jgi:HPt (histidine-containing phosphotransfer) domain-containing protein
MDTLRVQAVKTAAPESTHTEQLLDVETTLARFAGDEMLLGEIACVFVRTVPQLLTSISSALTANDMKTAFHQAHSLKGAVAAFEAPLVLNAVKELEAHAKNNDAATVAASLPGARSLVERMLGELASMVPANTPNEGA